MNQRLDNHSITDDVLAERLRHLRKQAGLSQKALAVRLGISGPAVAQWETGRHRPDTRWLPKLATLLNCQVSDLRPDLFLNQSAEPNPTVVTPADQHAEWRQHADLIRLDSPVESAVSNASPATDQLVTTSESVPAPAVQRPLAPPAPVVVSPIQLRRARQQRRLERRELAALLHVDPIRIQDWEQGTATPNDWQAHRLMQVLGLKPHNLRATASQIKFTHLHHSNAVRVPILPIYEQPPTDHSSVTLGHMPALHPQATVVFRLPLGRWATAIAPDACVHAQVSPCRAGDLPERARAVRRMGKGLALRQRLLLEGESVWYAPASLFGAAEVSQLLPDEWVWQVWALVELTDDREATSEWPAYT
ncbi:MAG: helix-turn-helix transcriptional regulator [Pseudomonadota bacterium]|nr:helix-turn-helix transcriptional regulator [Pseudomonadota bacterium]